MTEPGEGQRPPAARLHLRDRAAGLRQALDAARASATGPAR